MSWDPEQQDDETAMLREMVDVIKNQRPTPISLAPVLLPDGTVFVCFFNPENNHTNGYRVDPSRFDVINAAPEEEEL